MNVNCFTSMSQDDYLNLHLVAREETEREREKVIIHAIDSTEKFTLSVQKINLRFMGAIGVCIEQFGLDLNVLKVDAFCFEKKRFAYADFQSLASLMSTCKDIFAQVSSLFLSLNKQAMDAFTFESIKNSYPLVLRRLLQKEICPNMYLQKKDQYPQRLITYAAIYQNPRAVQLLIEHKAEVDFNDLFIEDYKSSRSPFCHAILNGDIKTAEILRQAGADINENFSSHTPLSLLFYKIKDRKYQFLPVLKSLLMMPGINTEAYLTNMKLTVLMQSIHFSKAPEFLSALQMLIDAGANVQAADSDGRTVLMRAVATNEPKIVHMLLEKIKIDSSSNIKTYVNSRCLYHFETAITTALIKNYEDIFHQLLQAGADIDVQVQLQDGSTKTAAEIAHDKSWI